MTYINLLYQNRIAKRVKNLSTYSYDASDAAHTITNGVGGLPSDFLSPARVYDGDTSDNKKLTQILDIEDKVDDDDETSQYMLPNSSTIWIFGKTPTNTIKLYYYAKLPVLTDSAGSNPLSLKEEFHVEPFVLEIQRVFASLQNDADTENIRAVQLEVKLDEIESAHNTEMYDNEPPEVEVEW